MIKLRLQLLFLFCVAFQFGAQAQIPDGTPAPDWTAVDLNGVEHDMSDILDLNKHVVLEFSATWCGPCWMQQFYLWRLGERSRTFVH